MKAGQALSSRKKVNKEIVDDKVGLAFNHAEIEGSIPERYAKVVRRYPNQTAVAGDHQALSFTGLDRASNRIAHAILNQQQPNDNPVALLLSHGVQAIAALFGALKSGKVCLAVDPTFPLSKISEILQDTGADLLIANKATNEQAVKCVQDSACRLIDLDQLAERFPDTSIKSNIFSDSPALIILTSGTTGRPKGVTWDHRALLHLAFGQGKAYHLGNEDRHSLVFPFESGAGYGDILSSLLYGAGLYLHNPRQSSRADLIKWLIRDNITVLHPPVTLFRQILEAIDDEEDMPSLRLIILGGQALRPVDIKNFRRRFHAPPPLAHQYALNIAGVAARYFIDSQTVIKDRVPAGYADFDKKILILDDAGQEVAEGEIGEIGVKSRYLAPGYWRNPELTRQLFLPDPEGSEERVLLTGDLGRIHADGLLEHHGRKDFQTKIDGFTVQPDAIEAALREWAIVKDAAVIAGKDSIGETRLIAYIVPSVAPAPPSDQIRGYLADRLPDYMVPAVFVTRTVLPLNSNGKLDRKALPSPDRSRPDLSTPFTPPGTPLEAALARIWAEVLELNSMGIHDQFLDLGGNSLLAARIAARVEEEIGTATPPATLFTSSTISAMALTILAHQAQALADDELAKLFAELEELSDDEAAQS